MALCGHNPFGQCPVRKLWEFHGLAIFVEWHPHLGEVVQVASQAVTTRSPFKRLRFESVVYLVQLVNEQHARSVAFERTHQRTGTKEISPFEVRLHGLPALVLAL